MFPAVEAHTDHRVLVRRGSGPIVPPPPDPGDLAGKYGVQAPAKDFEATLLGPNPPPGDSDQVMLSTDRSPRSESKYPVERPSSYDTVHNARLAMKGSVQQSPVDRPVYSEHAPVMPGPGIRAPGPCARYPVLGSTDHTGKTGYSDHTGHTGFTEFNGHTGRISQTSPHWSESSIGKGRPVRGPV